VAQQSRRKFPPAVPTTRTSDAEVQGRKDPTEFAAAHASIHNHFNHDRHLNRREIFKQNRAAALADGVNSQRESLDRS